MNFKDFNIDENLVQALAKIGIKEPTRVQLESISLIIDKRDLMIKSNTGTGKTLSFLLPLIDKILKKDIDSILILAPTRELVLQINDMAVDIISHIGDENIKNTVNILPIYGGKDIKAQINKLKKSINILVATPGLSLIHI